ncbi:hypothetical protein CK203_112399 [Vitis vinifera]|uniref:Retrotransposon gag domain-containing protein n=1 Tax=Vitis vinifera TaxID=29760 RepID=A0A438CF23_VITVI|nr:hypothetical protein CK203_112399 [Vitis vinifera]
MEEPSPLGNPLGKRGSASVEFVAAMASIQEALASLGQRIDGQQDQQTKVALLPITLSILTSKDPHVRMDRLEQRMRTWDDLAQEFLRQFAFNTIIDVSRRDLEVLRQRSDESVTLFISC